MKTLDTSPTLHDLLAPWADRLSPEDVDAIRRVQDRLDAASAYARPFPDDPAAGAVGFLRVDRVLAPAPVALFGQDTPAMAFSRITVARGERDGQGGWRPSAIVFVARMSDRALTQMILSSNSSVEPATLTVERLGATVLPAYAPPARRDSDQAFAQAMASMESKSAKALDDLRAAIDAGASAKARDTAKAALQRLKNTALDADTMAFYLQQRLDTLGKRRVAVVADTAAAAVHAATVSAATALLEGPAPGTFDPAALRATDPMLDAALDGPSEEEARAIRRLLALWYAEKTSTTSAPDAEITHWPTGQDLARVGIAADDRPFFEEVGSYARYAQVQRAAPRDPRQAIAHLTQSSGWQGFMHSSLPNVDGKTCSIGFETAWNEDSFGSARVRGTHHAFLEIMTTPDDLMLALRGHPSGSMVPCTFRVLAGQWTHQDTTARETAVSDAAIQDAKRRVLRSDQAAAFRAAHADLLAHLDAPRADKAWKAEAAVKADALGEATRALWTAMARDGFGQGAAELGAQVGTMVRAAMEDIAPYLPGHVLDAMAAPLLLSGDTPKG